MYDLKTMLKDLFVHHVTPARFFMHKEISRVVRPEAPVLDIGGGPQSYLRVVSGLEKKDILLLDLLDNADIVCNIEEGLPVEDARYRTVFMFNVLELVYDHRSVISEIHRVLAQGGTAYIWSPFLINIHHHPNDYFRYSEKALEKIMHEAGFSECSIRPFGGLVVIIGTYCGQLVSFLPVLQDVVHALCLPLNALLSRLKKNNRTYWPLGYMVVVKK